MRRHALARDQRIPRATLDELDEAIAKASRGDRHAIACIAIAFGRALWKAALDATHRDRSRASDVLQSFYLSLLEGGRPFDPAFDGRAIPWMDRRIQAIAAEQEIALPSVVDGR